jgi:hypothetical protein
MRKKVTPKDPAKELTSEEAERLANGLLHDLNFDPDALARYTLLLRWFSEKADDDDRETLYINTEAAACSYMNGVDEAVREQMRRQLELLRKGGAR